VTLDQFWHVVQIVNLTVDTHPNKSLRAQVVEQIDIFAFAADDQWRKYHQSRFFRQFQYVINHLRDCLCRQRQIVVGALRFADPCIQQAQVVVNLGDRAYRRTRVVATCLLLDRDCRRQALDQVDIGFFHQLEELARI